MPARIRRTVLTDEWKARIKASNLVTRLNKHVKGQVEMSATQIQAAKILLGKVVPDLKSIDMRAEHTGKDGAPIENKLTVEFVGKE